MTGAVAALLDGGRKLHLQHGPIDLLITAEGPEGGRDAAFPATARFDGLLEELVAELADLRAPLLPSTPPPDGALARRMHAACPPYSRMAFITRMAAVAGSVADEISAAMQGAAPLRKHVVNNGGDIGFDAAPGEILEALIADPAGKVHGRISLPGGSGLRGMATSGRCGRSFSLGIADSVTVLARCAAEADAAATMIANAVDLPGHPRIRRAPAHTLAPDSDLGERLVVTGLGNLTTGETAEALDRGLRAAEGMRRGGLIAAAALFLNGDYRLSGDWPPSQPALPPG